MPRIPKHVFVSFAQTDRELVENVVRSLRRANIPVWVDFSNLTVGTPDWEASIRKAIDESFAIVLVATPESVKSQYVKGELSVAQSRERPIIPLWADGTDWAECVPLDMAMTQHIDCRLDAFEAGIADVIRAVQAIIDDALPSHYHISPLRSVDESSGHRRITTVESPPGYFCVEFNTDCDRSWDAGGEGVMCKLSEYENVRSLLDELYISYLSDIYAPYAYGREWILTELSSHYTSRILAPWSWASCEDYTQYELDIDWSISQSLANAVVLPNSSWNLGPLPNEVYGVAVNDVRIIEALDASPKAEYFLTQQGVLELVPIGSVNPEEHPEKVLFNRRRRRQYIDNDEDGPFALVQTQAEIPEEELNHWFLFGRRRRR